MNSISQYKEKYSRFCTHLRRNWINVLFHEKVAEILQNHCDNTDKEQYITDEISPIGSEKQANIKLKNRDLLGFVKSSTGAGSEWALEWTLVSSIALFEAFSSDIAELVYLSNPCEFLLSEQTESAKIELELLLECETKQEAIEKYIEQKLISIFSGNPSDAFVKYNKNSKKGMVAIDGKLKIDTGSYLDSNCKNELQLYIEMTRRRNVIVHNAGIINSRYIKEVPDDILNKLEIGNKVKISKDYLFENITLARFYAIKATHTAHKMGNKIDDDELLRKLEKQFK